MAVLPFYDKKMAKIQRNAKKIASHPVLSSIDNIQSQLNALKSSHRRFIYALLLKQFGEEKARSLMHSQTLKKIIDNFDDFDVRALKQIDKESKEFKKEQNLLNKLKLSLYYREVSETTIKQEVSKKIEELFPDLVDLPKNIKKTA